MAVVPPSVIAVWYFMPSNIIRPYVGAGIYCTFFLSEITTSDLDDAFGLVAQGGVGVGTRF